MAAVLASDSLLDMPTQQNYRVFEKNTFVSVDEEEDLDGSFSRRSSSLPPSLRGTSYEAFGLDMKETDTGLPRCNSVASTAASLLSSPRRCDSSGSTTSEAEATSDIASDVTRTRLSSAASKFELSGPQAEMKAAVAAAMTALAGSGVINSVMAGQDAAGNWAVTASIPFGKVGLEGHALNLAKQALLQSAEKSNSVYVMGYLARPFHLTAQGFDAVLCNVEDEASACWDFLGKGCCYQRGRCQWLHPALMARVKVLIQIDPNM